MNLLAKLLVGTLVTTACAVAIAGTVIAIPLLAGLPSTTTPVIIKSVHRARVVTLAPMRVHATAPSPVAQPIPLTFNTKVEPIPTQIDVSIIPANPTLAGHPGLLLYPHTGY